jgi:hypothetical protein
MQVGTSQPSGPAWPQQKYVLGFWISWNWPDQIWYRPIEVTKIVSGSKNSLISL